MKTITMKETIKTYCYTTNNINKDIYNHGNSKESTGFSVTLKPVMFSIYEYYKQNEINPYKITAKCVSIDVMEYTGITKENDCCFAPVDGVCKPEDAIHNYLESLGLFLQKQIDNNNRTAFKVVNEYLTFTELTKV